MSRISSRILVFTITIIVVIIASSGGASLVSSPTEPVSHPEFDIDQLLPTQLDRTGTVEAPRTTQQQTILIDKSHINRLESGDLEPLVAALTAANHQVIEVERRGTFQSALGQADAVILADPAVGYTNTEVSRLESFVEAGGRLVILGEPRRSTIVSGQLATRRMRFGGLLDRLGISFGSSVYDMQHNDGNFRHLRVNATAAPPGSPFESAVLYTAATVSVEGGEPVLETSSTARTDRAGAPGPHTVAALRENVLVVGDVSFLRNDRVTVGNNARLGSAVAAFLVRGSRDRGVQNYPFYITESSTVHYTWDRLLPAGTTLGDDLRRHGYSPSVTLEREAVSSQNTDVLITTFAYLRDHPEIARTAGIRLKNETVRAGGMQTTTPGVVVIRAPRQGYDLVIASDTPERNQRAIEVLADPSENQWAWDRASANKRTLVFTGDPSTVVGI